VPHQLYGALRLPVVSYALPALIAIGQVRHHFLPTRNPLTRLLRNAARARTLRLLETIQPVNGGFLEATPLTSFVTMSLAGMGLARHPVARRGVEFLRASQRADGSWPIDTNLATWVTTLAVNALPAGSVDSAPAVLDWLLGQQYRVEHPYTHAAPGGWAWTNLPGGVPDADDTPGAMLAVMKLAPTDGRVHRAVAAAARWLLDLQNRDGGIPTFCRGWGALPFDRSSPDLTAHTLRAWLAFRECAGPPLRARIESAVPRAVKFLRRTQRADGAWVPLWFGHQEAPDDENPLYGTTRVLCALAEVERTGAAEAGDLIERAVSWLGANQSADGGWAGVKGPASSVEETALAIEALAGIVILPGEVSPARRAALVSGTRWLIERVEDGTWRESSPIGFYFARLWYFERLYPLIFSAAALNAVRG
jgi:squalene-hopene/tetraprenyl-beta-curcumene cyclase